MLFHTSAFLFVFLPLVFAGWLALGRWSWGIAIAWLALASVVFYGMWAPAYVLLLLASIAVNYGGSLFVDRLRTTGRTRGARIALGLLIALDLAILGYFKYANFFVAQVEAALGAHWNLAAIALPIGISFYTFTQIAYLVDTFQGKVRERSPLTYLLFVTWFPHLVAGPIIHHAEMIPQFLDRSRPRFDATNAAAGLTFLTFGLFKKIVLADGLAPVANAAFGAPPGSVAATEAWIGALAYTMQIYFDFSGYSDMAVGVSLLFNIRLPVNFWSPYRAFSIIEFWRRWHMTLSRFLRDYLYIPLGGNRRGPRRRTVNLIATMALGGLWHGANWTFVAWGLLHGAYLVVNHQWRQARRARGTKPDPGWLRIPAWAATFVAVLVAWVFFRAADLPSALAYLGNMLGASRSGGVPLPLSAPTAWLLGAACLIAWFAPNTNEVMRYHFGTEPKGDGIGQRFAWKARLPWGAVVGCALLVTLIVGVTSRDRLQFLYFQF